MISTCVKIAGNRLWEQFNFNRYGVGGYDLPNKVPLSVRQAGKALCAGLHVSMAVEGPLRKSECNQLSGLQALLHWAQSPVENL